MSSLMDDLFGNQRQQKQDLKHDYKEINDQSRMSRHVSKKKQLPKNNVIQKEDDTLHVPYLTNKANNSSLKSKPFSFDTKPNNEKQNTFNKDNIANKPKIKTQKEIIETKPSNNKILTQPEKASGNLNIEFQRQPATKSDNKTTTETNGGKANMIIKDVTEEIKNTTSNMSNGKIFISEPTKYKEVEKSADLLLQGNPFIAKLNKFAESNQLKEMVYFLRGIIYAANGNIKEIDEKTFLCTPKTIEVEDLFGNDDAQEKDNSNSSTITKTIVNKS